MSTKYFRRSPGVQVILPSEIYSDGNLIEWHMHPVMRIGIAAWHNVPQSTRAAIITRLTAAGWVEGEQSKPD